MNEDIFEHIRELAPFKIEFVDNNDNYHKLDSYIKGVFEDYILIAPPSKHGKHYRIENNKEVNLIFPKNDGIFIAECMVIATELDAKPGIKISFPHNTKTIERREYIRIPLKPRLEVICYKDKSYSEQKSFMAIPKNISGSGIAFYHKEPIDNYYEIVCKIFFNDGIAEPVTTKNDLVYSKKVKIKGEDYYLTALTYTSISEADLARIVKECFKFQVRNKKIKNY